ncbi:integrase catalytic domain-containing protein [Azospirillum soli]|uniref:integrase catalytic domain-containing protein n=1 Tax=Azospirillum soli TaxID=1304799 RepID=UPI001AE5A461|nr:DDE-type integrase/transposase/recombinase [Azospirillum soli]MBP2316935.1 hypothetical protein [Azospirillum soli]
MSATAQEAGIGVERVREWLRCWWRFGQVRNALVPLYRNRGAPGRFREPGFVKRGRPRNGPEHERHAGVNVDETKRQLIVKGALKFLKQGHSMETAYQLTIKAYFSEIRYVDGVSERVAPPPAERITVEQFAYYARRVVTRVEVVRRNQGGAYPLENRSVTGTTSGAAYYPGAVFQIDATIADIYLLSELNPGHLVGTPLVYLVIDHYSHVIVGFYIGLADAGWEPTMLAMESAMTSKIALLQAFDIIATDDELPYACPEALLSDRGPEYTSRIIEGPLKSLDFRGSVLPPRRPDLKGLVESSFNLLRLKLVKWRPGSVDGLPSERRRHRCDATYTLSRFKEAMLRYILRYNRTHRVLEPPPGYVSSDGRPPTPLELWHWGVAHCGPPMVRDREYIRSRLLWRGVGRESEHGLRIGKLYYTFPTAERCGWFDNLPGRNYRQHDIGLDRRDVSTVRVFLDGGRKVEEGRLTGKSERFRSFSLDEVEDYFARLTIGLRRATAEDLDVELSHLQAMERLDRAAKADRLRLLGGASKPTTKALRETRAAELAASRASDAWTQSTHPPLQIPPAEPDAEYLPRPSRVNALRRVRDGLPPNEDDV